jgi:hypothetical protein
VKRQIETLLRREGAASELEYHPLLAKGLKLIEPKDYWDLTQCTADVKHMLTELLPC